MAFRLKNEKTSCMVKFLLDSWNFLIENHLHINDHEPADLLLLFWNVVVSIQIETRRRLKKVLSC